MAYNALLELLGPQFWWMWESIIVICYFVAKFVEPIGKTAVLRAQKMGDGIQIVGLKWIRRTGHNIAKYPVKKGESHTQELAASPFTWTRGNPALIQFVGSTRPARVTIEDPEHNIRKKAYNPDSSAFDDFAEQQAYAQGEKANRTPQTSIGDKLVWAIMGGALGALAVYIYASQPHAAVAAHLVEVLLH